MNRAKIGYLSKMLRIFVVSRFGRLEIAHKSGSGNDDNDSETCIVLEIAQCNFAQVTKKKYDENLVSQRGTTKTKNVTLSHDHFASRTPENSSPAILALFLNNGKKDWLRATADINKADLRRSDNALGMPPYPDAEQFWALLIQHNEMSAINKSYKAEEQVFALGASFQNRSPALSLSSIFPHYN